MTETINDGLLLVSSKEAPGLMWQSMLVGMEIWDTSEKMALGIGFGGQTI